MFEDDMEEIFRKADAKFGKPKTIEKKQIEEVREKFPWEHDEVGQATYHYSQVKKSSKPKISAATIASGSKLGSFEKQSLVDEIQPAYVKVAKKISAKYTPRLGRGISFPRPIIKF